METETLGLAREIDFSMLALFARATPTVKIVMIVLVVASFWSWSIIIQKLLNYRQAGVRRPSLTGRFGRVIL